MDSKLLIDAIMQQTTVLIAQLSTAAGIRAPLAHVADQVFLSLSREIEAQGVSRKVVADMFGLAIRSYQKKVQRLAESETEQGTTLWHAVLIALQSGSLTRTQLLERFSRDPEREVLAVLHDLVSSGFAFSTGRGAGTRYGVTSDADRHAVVESEQLDSLCHVMWLEVQTHEPLAKEELLRRFARHGEMSQRALRALREDGSVVEEGGQLRAKNFVIPMGAESGWEAAVLDHYQTMVRAIGAKLNRPTSAHQDVIGGSTLRFTVHPGHPAEARVKALLREVRALVLPLWEEVAHHNEVNPLPPQVERVSFYFGQTIESDTTDELEETDET